MGGSDTRGYEADQAAGENAVTDARAALDAALLAFYSARRQAVATVETYQTSPTYEHYDDFRRAQEAAVAALHQFLCACERVRQEK